MYSNGPLHMAKQKQDDQLEHTHSSYVRIRDVALKTCQRRWMIGRSGERGSGISVLAARYDDDDDIFNNGKTASFFKTSDLSTSFHCGQKSHLKLYVEKQLFAMRTWFYFSLCSAISFLLFISQSSFNWCFNDLRENYSHSFVDIPFRCNAVVKELDCGIVVSEFKLQSRYNVHFRMYLRGYIYIFVCI